MSTNKLCSLYAVFIGAFFLLEGFWGLSSTVILGSLTTNTTHASIHIILGVAGLYYGIKRRARIYNMTVGILLIIVGSLRFLKETADVIVNVLNVNEAVAYLNLALGTIAFMLGIISYRVRRLRHYMAVHF